MIGRAAAAVLIALGLFLCVAEFPVPVLDKNGPTGDASMSLGAGSPAASTGDQFIDRVLSQMRDGR